MHGMMFIVCEVKKYQDLKEYEYEIKRISKRLISTSIDSISTTDLLCYKIQYYSVLYYYMRDPTPTGATANAPASRID